jgi:hypothetical protein
MYRVLGSDGVEYGPVSAEQVRRWIAERRIISGTLLCAEGSTAWQPITMFPEFAGSLHISGPAPVAQAAPQNSLAITGLVCSALGILCCLCGPLFAVLGIVFSCVALSQINNTPGQRGKELAIAGIILGGLALLESILLWLGGAFAQLLDHLN